MDNETELYSFLREESNNNGNRIMGNNEGTLGERTNTLAMERIFLLFARFSGEWKLALAGLTHIRRGEETRRTKHLSRDTEVPSEIE